MPRHIPPATPSGDRTEPMDVATVTTPEVFCDGAAGAEAHPRVYLTFGLEPVIRCPYCNRRFHRRDAKPPGPLH